MTRMYVDIHVLQTVPPSNLNRDDAGSPKTAVYGGVRRARVSSQAWKRAARGSFSDSLERADIGFRTKRVVELIVDRMLETKPDLDRVSAAAAASDVLKQAGLEIKPAKARPVRSNEESVREQLDTSTYLVFLSGAQVDRLADLACSDAKPSKKEAQEAFGGDTGIEVGLFGRMVADDKALNVDASVQVAHAISTHEVAQSENDYFTAVDDLSPKDESGAGMLGNLEFNSATLYRYATVDVAGLRANLGDDAATARAVAAFLRGFVMSMPSGKQNTFANRTVPDGVVVMTRSDQPVNLVGAFEDAVAEREAGGRVRTSSERLVEQARSVLAFVAEPTHAYVSVGGRGAEALGGLADPTDFSDVVAGVEEAVRSALAGG